jgi:hypothetical protein
MSEDRTTIDGLIKELQEVSKAGFGDKDVFVGRWTRNEHGHLGTEPSHDSSVQITCNGDGTEWHIIDTGNQLP